ncbi:Uncharacterized protein LSUB1_G004085 [Lachnellula subtilissima]|uniref:DUF1989 domain-containing protein n=1 Tax=Lachnellula subtilissima TaxID=602034 RepID=A0A8H8RUC2_9HELO|nr:Uncharacterized protein LSUB1_G004085 [Lachnellula subtilissima]
MSLTTIPARHGIATPLAKGSTIKVINTRGTQVVDTWAFTLSSFPPSPSSTIETQMSNQHTRACLNSTIPKVGDGLFNNKRERLLTLVEDTTAGIHDTLIAACDEERYLELAGEKGRGHRNCADNLVEGLAVLGIKAPQFTPSPLNLFMNIPVHDDHTTLSFEAPTSKEGQYVCLKAEVDLVIAFSACPQDILKINCGEPVDAHFQIL